MPNVKKPTHIHDRNYTTICYLGKESIHGHIFCFGITLKIITKLLYLKQIMKYQIRKESATQNTIYKKCFYYSYLKKGSHRSWYWRDNWTIEQPQIYLKKTHIDNRTVFLYFLLTTLIKVNESLLIRCQNQLRNRRIWLYQFNNLEVGQMRRVRFFGHILYEEKMCAQPQIFQEAKILKL